MELISDNVTCFFYPMFEIGGNTGTYVLFPSRIALGDLVVNVPPTTYLMFAVCLMTTLGCILVGLKIIYELRRLWERRIEK